MRFDALESCLILSDLSCYFDTGKALFSYAEFRLDFDFEFILPGLYNGIISTSILSTNEESWLYNNTYRFRFPGINTTYPFVVNIGERIVLTLERKNGIFYVYTNGTLLGSSAWSGASLNSIVFPRLQIPPCLRVHTIKMRANGNAILNAYPILHNNNVEMYDEIENRILQRYGTALL